MADPFGLRPSGTFWLIDLAASAMPSPQPAPAPRVPAAFSRLGTDMAAELARAAGPASTATTTQRLQTGRRCYAAWIAGEPAAYCWVSFAAEPIGEQGLRLNLAPGEGYIFDCATRPAWQGHGLYTALLAYIVRELRREGFARVWIGADTANTTSHSGIERAGFHAIVDLLDRPLLGLRLMRLRPRPGAPAAHVALARRALFGRAWQAWKLTRA
jgi:GNAT superfamily N-acetyltransferase